MIFTEKGFVDRVSSNISYLFSHVYSITNWWYVFAIVSPLLIYQFINYSEYHNPNKISKWPRQPCGWWKLICCMIYVNHIGGWGFETYNCSIIWLFDYLNVDFVASVFFETTNDQDELTDIQIDHFMLGCLTQLRPIHKKHYFHFL